MASPGDRAAGLRLAALAFRARGGHLEQILAAMDAASGRVPTIVVRHHFPQPDKPFFQKGTPGWELHPEIKARPRDLLIEKTMPGSFTGTPLEDWLRALDSRHVAVSRLSDRSRTPG